MSKDSRARYLRQQRERLTRKRTTSAVPDWTEPGRAGEAYCEPCDLRFEQEMNMLGLPTLELDWRDEDTGEVEHQSIPVTEWSNWFVPCPRCGGTATITNTQVGVDSRGDRWWYFARPDQRAEISELLGFLRDDTMTAEEVIEELGRRGPTLAALAAWLREQSASVPRIVVEVVLGVLLTQLIFGDPLTTDDLERILKEQHHQHRQEQHEPSRDDRDEPRGKNEPPGGQQHADRRSRTLDDQQNRDDRKRPRQE